MNGEQSKLHSACLNAASASREIWLHMKHTGRFYTWDYYRAWLLDARAVRLGQGFQHLANSGERTPYKRAPLHGKGV